MRGREGWGGEGAFLKWGVGCGWLGSTHMELEWVECVKRCSRKNVARDEAGQTMA